MQSNAQFVWKCRYIGGLVSAAPIYFHVATFATLTLFRSVRATEAAKAKANNARLPSFRTGVDSAASRIVLHKRIFELFPKDRRSHQGWP